MRPNKNAPVRAITVSPERPGLKHEEILDRKTVAKLLGVSTATLKTWLCERKGRISDNGHRPGLTGLLPAFGG